MERKNLLTRILLDVVCVEARVRCAFDSKQTNVAESRRRSVGGVNAIGIWRSNTRAAD